MVSTSGATHPIPGQASSSGREATVSVAVDSVRADFALPTPRDFGKDKNDVDSDIDTDDMTSSSDTMKPNDPSSKSIIAHDFAPKPRKTRDRPQLQRWARETYRSRLNMAEILLKSNLEATVLEQAPGIEGCTRSEL